MPPRPVCTSARLSATQPATVITRRRWLRNDSKTCNIMFHLHGRAGFFFFFFYSLRSAQAKKYARVCENEIQVRDEQGRPSFRGRYTLSDTPKTHRISGGRNSKGTGLVRGAGYTPDCLPVDYRSHISTNNSSRSHLQLWAE